MRRPVRSPQLKLHTLDVSSTRYTHSSIKVSFLSFKKKQQQNNNNSSSNNNHIHRKNEQRERMMSVCMVFGLHWARTKCVRVKEIVGQRDASDEVLKTLHGTYTLTHTKTQTEHTENIFFLFRVFGCCCLLSLQTTYTHTHTHTAFGSLDLTRIAHDELGWNRNDRKTHSFHRIFCVFLLLFFLWFYIISEYEKCTTEPIWCIICLLCRSLFGFYLWCCPVLECKIYCKERRSLVVRAFRCFSLSLRYCVITLNK